MSVPAIVEPLLRAVDVPALTAALERRTRVHAAAQSSLAGLVAARDSLPRLRAALVEACWDTLDTGRDDEAERWAELAATQDSLAFADERARIYRLHISRAELLLEQAIVAASLELVVLVARRRASGVTDAMRELVRLIRVPPLQPDQLYGRDKISRRLVTFQKVGIEMAGTLAWWWPPTLAELPTADLFGEDGGIAWRGQFNDWAWGQLAAGPGKGFTITDDGHLRFVEAWPLPTTPRRYAPATTVVYSPAQRR